MGLSQFRSQKTLVGLARATGDAALVGAGVLGAGELWRRWVGEGMVGGDSRGGASGGA